MIFFCIIMSQCIISIISLSTFICFSYLMIKNFWQIRKGKNHITVDDFLKPKSIMYKLTILLYFLVVQNFAERLSKVTPRIHKSITFALCLIAVCSLEYQALPPKFFCSVWILWMPLKYNKRIKINRIVLLHHGYTVADVPYYYISFKTI